MREVWGSFHCLRVWLATGAIKEGDFLLLRTDSSCSCAIGAKGRATSPALHLLMLALYELAARARVRLQLRWVSREDIQARIADALSKEDLDDYFLPPPQVAKVLNSLGVQRVSLDAFASQSNAVAPSFISHRLECGAVASGALDHDWRRWSADDWVWCFPPVGIIAGAIAHAKACRAKVILIVPEWRSEPWWVALAAEPRAVTTVPVHGVEEGSVPDRAGIGTEACPFGFAAWCCRFDLDRGSDPLTPRPPASPPPARRR